MTPQKIILGKTASEALTRSGENAFLVIGRASHPDEPGRWVLHIVPATVDQLNNAHRVIVGTHRATKIKA
jgi:hypothetical protein